MIGMAAEFEDEFKEAGFDVTIPKFLQEMSEDALTEIIANYDGWIIGDDPATRRVLEAGVSGRLKACMRWGVGTNNVDFEAFKDFNIPIENTPGVFGREVADLACHYVTALARDSFIIDREVKKGNWHKPIGTSLWATKALIVGMGDIGKNLAKRLAAHDVEIHYFDPFVAETDIPVLAKAVGWPEGLGGIDVVIFTAPLNDNTFHMFNQSALEAINEPINLVNVGRGPLVEQESLIQGLKLGKIKKAALDVFEVEPFDKKYHSKLLSFEEQIILSSHNGSNTREAVRHVSKLCIAKLKNFLDK
jgi:D-3-phosphoglycerate dehydrogenase